MATTGIPSTFNWRDDPKFEGSPIQDRDSYIKIRNRVISLYGTENVHVFGQEYIPVDEPLVVAGSHRGPGDIPAMAEAFKGHGCVRFMTKKELIRMPIVGSKLFDKWGCIPVDRKNPGSDTIHESIQTLFYKQDPYLGIYPEGGIKRGKNIHTLQEGIGLIACFSGAKTIPIGITGAKIPCLCNMVINIGAPIIPESLETEYSPIRFRRSLSDKKKISLTTQKIQEALQSAFTEAISISKNL